MSIESVMPSNHLILCRPLFFPTSIFPSIRVFSSEPVLHIRWPKYWSFSFSVSPSNEYLGLISFRMDGLDLLAVQGTLKSLLQHHSSKASILWRSAFFIVQLSHSYVTIGKIIALNIWTSVGKVMSLLFNMLSSLIIAFLPRSKRLLISWLQSPSAVILEPKKIKSVHCFHCFPTFCHKVMGPDDMILVFWMLSFKPTVSLSSFTFIKRLGFVFALQESVCPVLCKFWGLYGGVNGDLLQEGLCHTHVCCTQSPRPSGRPLLTHTSARDTQTPKGRSGSVSVGSLGPIEGLHCVKNFYKHFTAMNSYNLHSDPVV